VDHVVDTGTGRIMRKKGKNGVFGCCSAAN